MHAIFISKVCKKLSCRRRIIKPLFEKLCPAVNYGTERYIFSHKSVALSTLARCKFSFYFFWKILHAPGFCLQKHVWTQKRQLFFKNTFFDRFVENTLNRTDESWYKTLNFTNFAQLWRGWRYSILLIVSLLPYYGRVKINFFAVPKVYWLVDARIKGLAFFFHIYTPLSPPIFQEDEILWIILWLCV